MMYRKLIPIEDRYGLMAGRMFVLKLLRKVQEYSYISMEQPGLRSGHDIINQFFISLKTSARGPFCHKHAHMPGRKDIY
jgi:hypothetical protein